ncbi:MAG: alpha/beta hydrolase [Candidatus Binatia bacterium]
MIPRVFLAVSVVGAGFTLSALLRGRHLSYLVVPYFFAAWFTGELALHHLAWQAVATVVFVSLGALHAWQGVVGLVLTFASWAGLIALQRIAADTRNVCQAALEEGLGQHYRASVPAAVSAQLPADVTYDRIVRPFKMRHPAVERVGNIAYGEAGERNLLDIYRPVSRPQRCPTLLQVHGGGWMIGNKEQQALPLMNFLSARGWVCVACNYRLSPKATFPDHLIDVKRALAWIRQHGAEYGADPNFIAVTGGSAGGHLSALTALTANDPALQPGFEDADTSVAACVPFYGVYDFLDRYNLRGTQSMAPVLEKYVMKSSPESGRADWEKASPYSRVRPDAPPFFVIHGTHDSLAFVEDAQYFVRALRAVSRNPVAYAELPGAQHAFEVFHSLRTEYVINAVAWFLEWARARTTG